MAESFIANTPAIGPFGVDTPAETAEPATGSVGSRYINPATRDYEFNESTGHLSQMPTLRQRVLLAVMTRKGSSTALPDFGISLPPKMGSTFEAEVTASVRSALIHLTDTERVMRIDSVVVEKGAGGRARVTISYTDTTAGTPDSVTL